MNDSETLDGVTDMDGNTDNMTNDGGGTDPKAIADSMSGSDGGGDDWVSGDAEGPVEADSGPSPFAALRSSEPHEDLDDVSPLKLSPEYASAYATRGTNKIRGEAATEAWMDLALAAACYFMLFMEQRSDDSDGSAGVADSGPPFDGPDAVGP